MKFKTSILVFLVLFSSGFPIKAATDEGYGEDETSLGQFVDSFTDLNNVSVKVSTERNATLDAMELNFTSGIPVYEDFTKYTEADPNGRIVVNSAVLFTVTQIERGDGLSYVDEDYGAAFFDQDFVYSFILNVTDAEAGDADDRDWTYIVSMGNTNHNPLTDPRLTILLFQSGNNDTGFLIDLRIDDVHAAFDIDTSLILNVGTKYYMTLTRVGGDDITLVIRTSSFLGPIKDTLAVTLLNFDDNFRYISALHKRNYGVDVNDWISLTLENLWNQSESSGYAGEGYFTTTDYLNFANGATLVQLTNTTIPGGTGITVEFSEDNSTWVNSIVLTDGFQSIDLRTLNFSSQYYLRYNLTGPGTDTPRLYQSRLITTQGIPIVQNVSGEWIEYQAASIINLTGVHSVGDLNSTFFIDGDTWNHTEVAGPPGHLIQINFTGVDPDAECLWVTIFYVYTGNVQHDFDIEMWNFTSSTWVDDGHLVDGVAFDWANSTIYAMRIPLDFLRGGQVRVQLNHEQPGNVNHELSIDYIRLIAKIPADVEAVEEFQFFWIVLAIALAMIILVLAKIWFEEGDP